MLKYIIFILIFNTLCFAQDFDVYEISDLKPVAKRQINAQNTKPTLIKPQDSPQYSAGNLLKNEDSVENNQQQEENQNSKNTNINVANKDAPNEEPKEDSKSKPKEDSKSKPKDSNSGTAAKDEKKSQDASAVSTGSDTKAGIAVETAKNNSSATKSSKSGSSEMKNPKYATTEHPGAALRGFYVFLGLSVLIVIYFVFKAFRLRPGAAPPAIVRKYGVVGRRSDMEMLPLPLAEEEDDDTLFDMGTQMNR